MKGKLNIPQYYNKPELEITSINMKDLLENRNPLNYLRQIYRENPAYFFDLRDELLLRGIEFKKEYQNNFLPSINFKPQNLIIVESNNYHFKKLDSSLLPISSLIERFQIKSDKFFHLISIEALAFFLKRKPLLIMSQFRKAGYKIISVENMNKSEVTENEENNLEDSIEVLFNSTEFNKFREYCSINNIKYFSELEDEFIQKFRKHRQVGESKYKNALKRIEQIKISKQRLNWEEKVNSHLLFFVNNSLINNLNNLNISYLEFLNDLYFNEKQEFLPVEETSLPTMISMLKENATLIQINNLDTRLNKLRERIRSLDVYTNLKDVKFSTIKRLFKFTTSLEDKNNTLDSYVGKTNIVEDLLEVLSKLKEYKNYNDLINKVKSQITMRNLELIYLKEKHTLEELGEKIALTRERVRQLIKKGKQKINSVVHRYHIRKLIELEFTNRLTVKIEEVGDLLKIKKENLFVFECVLKSDENLIVEDGKVILKSNNETIEKFKNLLNDNPQIVLNSFDISKIIISNKLSLTQKETSEILLNSGYSSSGDLFVKISTTTTDKLNYVFSRFFRKPLELNDSGLIILRETLAAIFNEDIPNNDRALLARVRDTKDVILIDKNTYCYFEMDKLNSELVEEINQMLKRELDKMDMIKADRLFEKNKTSLIKMGIHNYYHLYSIIQYFFKDKYSIGRGNTMAIYSSEENKLENKELLRRFLDKRAGFATKKEIIKSLKWKNYTLEQTIGRSDELIIYYNDLTSEYEVHTFESLALTYSEKHLILKFIKDRIKKDYFFPYDLLSEMEFDNNISEILYKAKITNLFNFSSLIKKLYPGLKGSSQFLYLERSEIKSIYDAISDEYRSILTREELENFLLGKGYAESTKNVLLLEIETKYYYAYTTASYINKNIFLQNHALKIMIQKYLANQLKDKPYISAFNLIGYSLDLQEFSEVELQPLLIASIAEELGFKIIHTTKDYRYDKWLILNPKLKNIENYVDLVYFVMFKKYKGNYYEKDIAEFLENNSLNHTKTSISYEIKNSDYFSVDNVGFLKIKERNHVIERIEFEV